jgi:hypothetical protein
VPAFWACDGNGPVTALGSVVPGGVSRVTASFNPRMRPIASTMSARRGTGEGLRIRTLASPPLPSRKPHCSGRPIAKGPVVGTVRECLAVVESGEAVVIFGGRAEHYYSNPGIRYVETDVPPVGTALVRRRADRRRVILDLEECSRDVAARLVDVAGQ